MREASRSVICAPSLLFFLIFCIVFVSACGPKVTRISPEETVDLSGRWNDTDSRMVAEERVKEALGRPWVENFTSKNEKPPTVIVGTVVNRSHEHINVQTFIKDLERELTNSGQVQFVAAKGEREEVREERLDQALNAAEETAKSPGKETGADYMLKGTLNTIVDESGKVKAVFYQVDLEMIDLESNVKVWFGQKKIKKVISRKLLGY
ncbi:MAG: penicillin-binding protein activator LpoB [Nitrospirae bacterium]|nr:penicillin-binding protein activator LpoB [Nitrospirota bacterium]